MSGRIFGADMESVEIDTVHRRHLEGFECRSTRVDCQNGYCTQKYGTVYNLSSESV